jgi:hypothetical protein
MNKLTQILIVLLFHFLPLKHKEDTRKTQKVVCQNYQNFYIHQLYVEDH